MERETLKRANKIAEIITNEQSRLDRLSHILNKDEFDFFIEDRCTGNSYKFSEELLPKDFYKFIEDYSEKVMAEIKKYEEEFKNL